MSVKRVKTRPIISRDTGNTQHPCNPW